MPDDVIEGEVVSHLPLKGKSGWCTGPEGSRCQHERCPAIFPESKLPDPARQGAFYTIPGHRCSCECHSRDLVSTERK